MADESDIGLTTAVKLKRNCSTSVARSGRLAPPLTFLAARVPRAVPRRCACASVSGGWQGIHVGSLAGLTAAALEAQEAAAYEDHIIRPAHL
jgi:hypothetical protein